MEYEEVVGRLLKRSNGKTEEQVETLLGYLYYDEPTVDDFLPIGFEDMEELLNHSKQIIFALDDGETPEIALKTVMDQIDFSVQRNIDTMVVKIIGDEQFEVEDLYRVFSPLEFQMNSNSETDVLLVASRDSSFEDRAIAIVVISSDDEF